ncbi:aspartic proteinase from Irpex Lacteus [Calocera cornea HHB12733]|uniref:Aspartic proteinase from Irpex Lacteus n=1 Tax=Calocera cornea HHB12733 TaxID=1353952 RepID=A0A165D0V0_9BASI|nr:aspartic proteinase from Irpex Lacteus [Calocera cornea HHB12733]
MHFLALLLLAVPALSHPAKRDDLLTLPIVPLSPCTFLNSTSHLLGLVPYEQQRIQSMRTYTPDSTSKSRVADARPSAKTIPAINYQYVQYTAVIGVGSPATTYNLVIDTGSSNTFVGTGKKYVKTKTSHTTNQQVYVSYGTGYFGGEEYLDQVTLGAGLVLRNQSIGVASSFAQFPGVDGILGLGPSILTQGTLYPSLNSEIPTVLDTAFTQRQVPDRVLGVNFAPTSSSNSVNGALTFGGVEERYAAGITYVPVTRTLPSGYYWGINVSSLDYGRTNLFKNDVGIVDTGTTLVYIADDYFHKYKAAIPGSTIDPITGLLEIPPAQLSSIQSLNFSIGGRAFTLSSGAQLIPQSEVTAFGGRTGHYYSYVGPMGSDSGAGFDFVLGQKFLERFYSVYDSTRNRVGLSYTEYTFTTTA